MKTTTSLVRLSGNLSNPISKTIHLSKPFRIPPSPHLSSTTPIRSFTSALTPLQTLQASRILPYRQRDLYKMIADIESYPSFLPYCKSSRITSHSSPDPKHSENWPHTATLNVGWGPYDETFKSRIYCLPYHTLEAIAGSASPTIAKSELPHYENMSSSAEDDGENSLFISLLTRWTLSEFPFKPLPPSEQSPQEGDAEANPSHPRTEVSLLIEARFNSAVYSALSQAAAPKVAGMMIEAFEKRARSVLGEGHGVEDDGRGSENRGRKTSTEGVVGDEGGKSWNKSH
ncbi:MAG: hypothetical protein Q9221_003942 [Calogaya cf. arnoldii]